MCGLLVATLGICGAAQAAAQVSDGSVSATEQGGRLPAPWKWDVTVYDRPGWTTPWLSGVRLVGDEVVLTCTSHPEESYYDDWYGDVEDTVTLASGDGGRTWRIVSADEFAPPAEPPAWQARIDVGSVAALTEEEHEERKRRLEEAGLGHLYEINLGETSSGWLMYPESMADELKAKGYSVFDDHPTMPHGQVGVHANTILARRSTDGGRTWAESVVEGLPEFGHGPVLQSRVRVGEATVLQAFYGAELHNTMRSVYVLWSTDDGRTWTTIGVPASAELSLTECTLLALDDGRVFLIMRCDVGGDGYLYASSSDDDGRTWAPAERTPMRGQPVTLLLLRSGAILATYCHRDFPAGIRATLSTDGGRTWDIDHEKILRDDVVPGPWISPAGAPSVQLEDDTILTVFTLTKVTRLKPGETADGGLFHVRPKYHSYVAASRYTVDYVRPLPGVQPDQNNHAD